MDRNAATHAQSADPRIVSRRSLNQRRSQLRRRRQWKLARHSWRLLAVGLVAIATAGIVTSPMWVIRGPEQVEVRGNRMLTDDGVRSLLGIHYPQPLWKLQPQAIAKSLRARGPVAAADITRQLLPPRLVVQVTELFPVAAIESTTPVVRPNPNPNPNLISGPTAQSLPQVGLPQVGLPQIGLPQIGLIDARGTWIDLERYQSIRPVPQLPTLKAIGDYKVIAAEWETMYRWLSLSPIAVQIVDWRDSQDLILQTELGLVKLGAYDRQRFAQQMGKLARMRSLPQQLDPRQIDYIDLRDLERPGVEMRANTLDKQAQQQLKPP
ncbi:MAG: FtsQ-type POTRA domain-containing protein [Oscillatoriales cyanobacterium]|nr:MAG: FtsQ-type POTRA domain-containing protein [Oscillatoriales cyanobacterium]